MEGRGPSWTNVPMQAEPWASHATAAQCTDTAHNEIVKSGPPVAPVFQDGAGDAFLGSKGHWGRKESGRAGGTDPGLRAYPPLTSAWLALPCSATSAILLRPYG